MNQSTEVLLCMQNLAGAPTAFYLAEPTRNIRWAGDQMFHPITCPSTIQQSHLSRGAPAQDA